MSNANRKLQRKKEKDLQKEVSKKVGLFNLMPDKCHICEAPYDKNSKEMAQTWIVVVRNEEKLVRLFCPECVDKVKEHLPNEET